MRVFRGIRVEYALWQGQSVHHSYTGKPALSLSLLVLFASGLDTQTEDTYETLGLRDSRPSEGQNSRLSYRNYMEH